MEHFIVTYGYLAIFLLVFLQEIGVPNPVSNELVLIFSGSLAYSHVLSFPLILFSAIAADISGTSLLYFISYFFGKKLLSKKWMPISIKKTIWKLTKKARKKGQWGIFVGRLIPFLRGYASVAAGLLHISPRVFLLQVICSAILWTGGYVTLGRFLGRYWMNATSVIKGIEKGGLLMLIVTIIIYTVRYFLKKRNTPVSG